MPSYLAFSAIDWHYEDAAAELKPSIRDAQTRLKPGSHHTDTTFEEVLREVAAAHPTIVADALIEDGDRHYVLFRVSAGRVARIEVDERPEGALDQPIELPVETIATVTLARNVEKIIALLGNPGGAAAIDGATIELPVRFGDEAEMRDLLGFVANAIDAAAESYVADVDGERFLIELAPGNANLRKLVAVTEPALVARLKDGGFAAVAPNPPGPDEKTPQALYWPEPMLQWMQDQAVRLDVSLSQIFKIAFGAAQPAIAASDREQLAAATRSYDGDKRKQTLYLPGAMIAELAEHASRLDSSLSFVAQAAVALGRGAVEARPAATA